jgi:4-carboxymuconolactone decarboxylase
MAHEAGVPEAVTDAIRRGAEPRLETLAARVVHRTAVALNRRHRLTDAEFAEAREVLGEQGLVDVVGLCGYYALVSLTLNAFEVPVPDGSRAFV